MVKLATQFITTKLNVYINICRIATVTPVVVIDTQLVLTLCDKLVSRLRKHSNPNHIKLVRLLIKEIISEMDFIELIYFKSHSLHVCLTAFLALISSSSTFRYHLVLLSSFSFFAQSFLLSKASLLHIIFC